MRIESIDLKQASDRDYAAMNTFHNRMRAERMPEDSPVPLDEEIRRLRNVPLFVDVTSWIVRAGREIAGAGNLEIFRTGDNPHVVEFSIEVLPELRRRGLGTRLLATLAQTTEREGRRLMITSTTDRVPDGEAFIRRLGARMGLATHMNQLDLRDLNRDLIPLWQERARERAAGFDLLVWTEGYPDDQLAAVAHLIEVMNLAPRGELETEDFHVTPEQARQWDGAMRARGEEIWTMVVRERATGRLAGFTQVSWHANRPEILHQWGTGVLAEFQNRGLGRWLKAAMLEKVLRERPQVVKIRTGNADMNAPMLKINTELGFRPYVSRYVWQVELAQVQAYLESVRVTKLAASG